MIANGAMDLKGWRIMTPEEIAADEEWARWEQEEFDKRWPPSQRRPRCMNCGAFVKKHTARYTRCKACDESYDSLQ